MDYEKKYKEALERAKKVLNSEATDRVPGTCIPEYIFPELKSEDENFIGCVACIYQDSCSSLQFGQGCTDGKEANRG